MSLSCIQRAPRPERARPPAPASQRTPAATACRTETQTKPRGRGVANSPSLTRGCLQEGSRSEPPQWAQSSCGMQSHKEAAFSRTQLQTTHTHISKHTPIWTCARARTCVHTYIHMQTRPWTCAQACTQTHAYTCMHTHTHTHNPSAEPHVSCEINFFKINRVES